jgi:hypothetical protein
MITSAMSATSIREAHAGTSLSKLPYNRVDRYAAADVLSRLEEHTHFPAQS